jgi:hypothetical protein
VLEHDTSGRCACSIHIGADPDRTHCPECRTAIVWDPPLAPADRARIIANLRDMIRSIPPTTGAKKQESATSAADSHSRFLNGAFSAGRRRVAESNLAPAPGPVGDPSPKNPETRWLAKIHRRRVTTFTATPATVRELLADRDLVSPGVDRVFVCGPAPADPAGWAENLPDGWEHGAHWLPGSVWRFRRGEHRVTVYGAGRWFGDETDPERCRVAWQILDRLVTDAFPGSSEAVLLATPSTTGRDLLQRTIGRGITYPTLDLDLADLIRQTAGQGRQQILATGPVEALVCYDTRLAYAAVLAGVPYGNPTRDRLDQYAGHVAGRYRVRATVPDGWQHVGILGVPGIDPRLPWSWPDRPGTVIDTWCDGAEVDLLRRYGWPHVIRERILWPERGALDVWARRLTALVDRVENLDRVGAEAVEVLDLVRHGLRAIILHTVGSFWSAGAGHGRQQFFADSPDQIPDGAIPYPGDEDDDGRIPYTIDVGTGRTEWDHPEWSAHVWARARVRLLVGTRAAPRGLLHVPRETLVGCHTDALWASQDPLWADDGRIGTMRRKGTPRTFEPPAPAPRTMRDLDRLKGSGHAAE